MRTVFVVGTIVGAPPPGSGTPPPGGGTPGTSAGGARGGQRISSIITRIAAAVDDPRQRWCSEPYVRPYLNQAWEDLYAEAAQYEINWPKRREVLALDAGASSLADFQTDGGQLADMVAPIYLEWKRATDPDVNYSECRFRERLPELSAETQGNAFYALRDEGTIYVTPSSVPTVLRVEFEVIPVEFNDLSDEILAGTRNVLAWTTAAKIAKTRGNDALAADMKEDAKQAREVLFTRLVKKKQRIPVRWGSQRRFSRRRWNWLS